ncbi:MAG: hypothetical protein NVS9B9_25220 [Ktedonobacteraceae bacterium]
MKKPNEMPKDFDLKKLINSLSVSRSRRAFIKGATAGAAVAGVAAMGAGALVLPKSAYADTEGSETSIMDIFSIAATAEQLAVTFYSHGLAHSGDLGLNSNEQGIIKAALVEEQLHELFFVQNGGVPLTSTFSFPMGPDTFTDLSNFLATQQQLEGVFDSAFLAAIKEFAYMNQAILAQIAGQIACIESEHRALGREIGALHGLSAYRVPDNWAYAPVFVESVSDAPAVVAAAGYLSPKPGNSYTYKQVSTDDQAVTQRSPFSVGEDND